MSLRHPENKMSKSSDDINGTIYFNDSKDSIIKKFKSSVTDSSNSIAYDIKSKTGISNLIEIYSSINNLEIIIRRLSILYSGLISSLLVVYE